MIPLRDHSPTETTPVVTYFLLAANVAVFLYMIGLSPQGLNSFVETYALQPVEFLNGEAVWSLFTSMFLHGGVAHIVGNMLFLNVFGDNLEDTLGHLTYLLFYLVAGVGAGLLQSVIEAGSSVPTLGASGAIAGLLGGYLVLFPDHKVDVLVPLGGFARMATVPAFTMLIYWIVIQFFQGIGSLAVQGAGGVAYFAHIGGFIAGALLSLLYRSFTSTGD